MLTPNHLEILLHFYVSSAPHPRAEAPAVQEAINFFLQEGMLMFTGSKENQMKTTEKANFWLEHLLDTPFPVKKLEIPAHPED